MEHVEALLPGYLSSVLDPEERQRVLGHLTACAACDDARRELSAAGTDRGALEQALRNRVGHFEVFADDLVELFGASASQVGTLLQQLEQGTGWVQAGNGVRMLWAPRSEKRRDSLCVLVHGMPGATLPYHRHGGEERTLVLQGGFREDDGAELWRGARLFKPPGTAHRLAVLEGPPCIAALRMDGHVAF